MKEKEIIKSERFNVLIVSGILVAIGVIGEIIIACNKRLMEGYKVIAVPLLIIIPILFLALAAIVYLCYSKVELTVTDKRVYGRATFGKRVDLPFDSISAVGTSIMKGIDVTSASGAIKFKFIKNSDEIHSTISKLLVERQGKEKTVSTTTIKQEIPQSNADELKKYKDLLDSGVITQEEFENKKKQLLGL